MRYDISIYKGFKPCIFDRRTRVASDQRAQQKLCTRETLTEESLFLKSLAILTAEKQRLNSLRKVYTSRVDQATGSYSHTWKQRRVSINAYPSKSALVLVR